MKPLASSFFVEAVVDLQTTFTPPFTVEEAARENPGGGGLSRHRPSWFGNVGMHHLEGSRRSSPDLPPQAFQKSIVK